MGHGVLDGALGRARLGQIDGPALHPPPSALDRAHRLGEARFVQIKQGQLHALIRQHVGRSPSHARTGPGDQRDTAF